MELRLDDATAPKNARGVFIGVSDVHFCIKMSNLKILRRKSNYLET
jgi:hypothetical protein